MSPVVVGWFEAVALPELGLLHVYAKIDSGADDSTLHARDVVVSRDGLSVEFTAPLLARQQAPTDFARGGVRRVRAPLVDERIIRSSSGHDETRYVIETPIVLGNQTLTTRLSLTNREGLRFCVLIGRSTLSQAGVLIDPSRSELLSPLSERTLPQRDEAE